MKSNVVLQSKDRILLGMNVSVMSKDGYICITDAMKALSAKREKLGLAPKQLSHIIETESFKERCTELVNKLENKLLLSRRNLLLNNNKLNISSVMDLGKLDLAYKKRKRSRSKMVCQSISVCYDCIRDGSRDLRRGCHLAHGWLDRKPERSR